jgi:hypothetical protein
VFGDGFFAPPRNIPRVGLGSQECSQTLVRCVANESFEAQTDGLGIRGRPACSSGFFEETVVNVQRLLHPYHFAIKIWIRKRAD